MARTVFRVLWGNVRARAALVVADWKDVAREVRAYRAEREAAEARRGR